MCYDWGDGFRKSLRLLNLQGLKMDRALLLIATILPFLNEFYGDLDQKQTKDFKAFYSPDLNLLNFWFQGARSPTADLKH